MWAISLTFSPPVFHLWLAQWTGGWGGGKVEGKGARRGQTEREGGAGGESHTQRGFAEARKFSRMHPRSDTHTHKDSRSTECKRREPRSLLPSNLLLQDWERFVPPSPFLPLSCTHTHHTRRQAGRQAHGALCSGWRCSSCNFNSYTGAPASREREREVGT